MATPEFKVEFHRLLNGEDEQARMDCYDLILDSGFKILNDVQKIKYTDYRLADANMLLQMSLLKMIACKRLSEVFEYKNPYDNGFILHDMRDPQSMWNIVRSQFEAFSNFNHLYRFHTHKEFNEILYDLWVISGLKNRQNHETTTEENIRKKEAEMQNILTLTNKTKTSGLYYSLDADNQRKIDNAIKEKDWKISYNGTYIKKLNWQELFTNAGCILMKSGYTFLSLNTHPSNVSVFQFREMFLTNHHHKDTLFALNFSGMLGAFLISDYCSLSPAALISYNSLPKMNQLLINSYNRTFRASNYAVNQIESEL